MVHIVDKLREDHVKINGLLETIRQQTNGSAGRRGELAQALSQVLAAHAAFEEAVFYPAVREEGDATEPVAEAVSELHDIEIMLNHLQDLEPASAEFNAGLREVEAAIAAHLRREEEEIFPLALRVLRPSQAEEMSERHTAMARNHA